MQYHNYDLLQALGCSLPQQRPGVKLPCPCHLDRPGSLVIRENRAGDYFECTDPYCRFYGDGVGLICAAKHISVADAVALLRPGGSLAHTLLEPLSDVEAAAYTESRNTQARLQTYLTLCCQQARQTPDRLRLRLGLSKTTLRLVPPEVGLLIPGEHAPAAFAEYNKTKYKNSTFVVYPFTYNDDVTHVQIQDATNTLHTTATIPVLRTDVGVFMERFDTVPENLIVTYNPRTAALLYGNCMAGSSKRPNIVAIAGFPLPERYRGVQTIQILATPDSPFTFADGLRVFAATELIAGSPERPAIHIWERTQPAEQLTAEQIISRDHRKGSELLLWLVLEMSRLLRKGLTEEIYKSLNAVTLTPEQRTALVCAAQHASVDQQLIDILQTAPTNTVSNLILGNGRTVRVGPTGIRAIHRTGDEDTLSNVGLQVSHKIRTHDGEEHAVCTVATADTPPAVVTINLPETAWNNPKQIQKTIAKAYAGLGLTPYVAIYNIRGYEWRDVLNKLSEGCNIYHEVSELGVDSSGRVHLPKTVLDPQTGTAAEQRQIFTLPQPVLYTYNGITPETPITFRDPYRYLLSGASNMYVAAFTAGIMHVLYQISVARYQKQNKGIALPRHLMYVETEKHIWRGIFQQLAGFFSNTDFVPILSHTHPFDTLNEYKMLGDLPLITHVPAFSGSKFDRIATDSPINLIGLLDSGTAATTDTLRVTYLVPSDKPEMTSRISDADINELQHAFTGFMLEYLHNVEPTSEYRNTPVPVVAAYKTACSMLGVTPAETVEKITRRTFTGPGMEGVDSFFDILHAILNADAKRPTIGIVHGMPTPGYTSRGQHVFITDRCVVISHGCVTPINMRYGSYFNADALTAELTERELLTQAPFGTNVDTNRCWVIPRTVWDRDVVRPMLQLDTVTQGSIIQLRRIA